MCYDGSSDYEISILNHNLAYLSLGTKEGAMDKMKKDTLEEGTFPKISGEEHKIPVREISVKSIVEKMLGNLSAKQKLVLANRFGIGNGGPKTLEAIGKNLNITRERVRQIEGDAIRILGKVQKDETLSSAVAEINDIVVESGGIILGEKLAREFFVRHFGQREYSAEEARLAEIIFLLSGLKKNKGNKEMRDSWTSEKFDRKYFRALAEEAEKIFDQQKKLSETEDLIKKIANFEFSQRFSQLKPEHIVSFLEVSKKFGQNVFGDWGKAKWPLISPRGVREKATLVLLKKKKPLHFRDISRMIEELGLSQKKVHPQTVHNELIRDKRFVLVGRGTYALREWGYEEGTVKDVIAKILRSAGGYLLKDKLYDLVLKKRKVKKATIAVNLADKNLFEKKTGGYQIKSS